MPLMEQVLEAQGRDMDSEGTLWDQDTASSLFRFVPSALRLAVPMSIPEETHENAIRILVEEAKVNLCLRSVGMLSQSTTDSCQCCDCDFVVCLRMMYDFKRWQQNPAERQATIEEAIKAQPVTIYMFTDSCSTGSKRMSMRHDAHRAPLVSGL